MKTDTELLSLAARSIGLEFSFGDEGVLCRRIGEQYFSRRWNPLADGGDALRLATKLEMAITVSNGETHVEGRNDEYAFEPHNGDPDAATRRAITRAAAEIQEQKERQK
jgi:hypothetical protein